jgi:hypothetical protein
MTDVIDTYLQAADVTAGFIAGAAVAKRWDEPSALPEMSVRALAGHLASQVFHTLGVLSADPAGQPMVTLLEHYMRSAWVNAPLDAAVNAGIRQAGEAEAAGGAPALARRLAVVTAGLRELLPGEEENRPVFLPWAGWNLTLEDYLTSRLLEIVIHIDDLAASVEVPPPELPEAATDATLTLLVRLAARRKGVAPVLRALSRTERASGSIVNHRDLTGGPA